MSLHTPGSTKEKALLKPEELIDCLPFIKTWSVLPAIIFS
jgi:hypothetical protein